MGRDAHPRSLGVASGGELGRIAVAATLEARFVRRYQRFFADVETAAGDKLTVHCPNPGSMLGFHLPGARVRCSHSDDPGRKLPHTLEMMRVGRSWVGLHTGRANAVVAEALRAGMPRALAGYRTVRREVAVAHAGERARLDFRLEAPRRRGAWLEVKSVTLAEGRLALFPDSVTLRGRRHLSLLSALRAQGDRAALLFLVQRDDCDAVSPADAIDPAYGALLRAAAARGVELFALGARVTPRGIRILRELPVRLP